MFKTSSLILLTLICKILSALALNLSHIDVIRNDFQDFETAETLLEPEWTKFDIEESAIYPVESMKLTPIRILIWDEAIMTILCDANIDGNYQDPFDCNQFIMCSSGKAFVWHCAHSGSYSSPADICVSTRKATATTQCPSRVMWDVGAVDCKTMGDRPWWSPLTIPMDPDIRCGSRVRYCLRHKEIGIGACPEGYGYCRSYNACLPESACLALDSWFRV